MSNNTVQPAIVIFDKDRTEVLGIAPEGTHDITYLSTISAAQVDAGATAGVALDAAGNMISRAGVSLGAPVGAVTDPATGMVEIFGPSGTRVMPGVNPNRKTLVRKSDTPIYTNTSQAVGFESPTIYWWFVFPAHQFLSNPLAKYYAYYSTDHDSGQGGIFIATSDSPTGPFTQYQASGQGNAPGVRAGTIFVDNEGAAANKSVVVLTNVANQTETPSVFFDYSINKLRMTYQAGTSSTFPVSTKTGTKTSGNGSQATLSATSEDGMVWTKDQAFQIDVSASSGGVYSENQPGDGHTGYFIPFDVDGRKYAYHLLGSGDIPHFALSCQGPEGKWETDYRGLGYFPNLNSYSPAKRVEWCHSFVIQRPFELVLCAMLTNFTSGVTAKDAVIGLTTISTDLRTPLRKFDIAWTPTLAWETANLRTVTQMVDANGDIYVYYVCKSADGLTQNVGVLRYE